MSPIVRVQGLTRRFGRRWALRGIDLEVERGTVVALLGANGTGKTTLLKVFSALLRPTAGRVEVLGSVLPRGQDYVRAKTTLMTPTGHTYEELTGLENLRFATRMSGPPLSDSSLHEILVGVRLENAANTRVRAYSTGMRKRLELARMQLRTPELVLLDEPFVSLDEEGVQLVQGKISDWRSAGTSVIIASHRIADATARADRIVRLERGRVASEETA